MKKPRKQIPPERELLYYGGMVVTAIGVLLFLSTFLTAAANFGNFNNFQGRVQSQMFCSVGGIILMAVGGIMRNIGTKGLAGSGVILDLERAREDVEPWSRMVGGVAQDALSEVEVVKNIEDRLAAPGPQVKVRCQKCQALNDESAKFCNQCGSAI